VVVFGRVYVFCKIQMIAYGPADATATPSSLASLKSEWSCLLWQPG